MRYLPIVILALLLVGFIAGCTSTTTPDQTGLGSGSQESVDEATVSAEAGSAVDSMIIEDTDEVEIGEMI